MVAYWADALADLRERNAKSVYARDHSYDAVSQLLEYKRARDKVMSGDEAILQGRERLGWTARRQPATAVPSLSPIVC
ncbi:hypothetical protein ABIB68_006572 [Bradyrhizobium sp. F1.2.2]